MGHASLAWSFSQPISGTKNRIPTLTMSRRMEAGFSLPMNRWLDWNSTLTPALSLRERVDGGRRWANWFASSVRIALIQTGRGLPDSKTCRQKEGPRACASILEYASPLAFWIFLQPTIENPPSDSTDRLLSGNPSGCKGRV